MSTLMKKLFGVLAVTIGVAIAGWVLYNTFIERQPEYRPGVKPLGFAAAMIGVGVYWIRGSSRAAGTSEAS